MVHEPHQHVCESWLENENALFSLTTVEAFDVLSGCCVGEQTGAREATRRFAKPFRETSKHLDSLGRDRPLARNSVLRARISSVSCSTKKPWCRPAPTRANASVTPASVRTAAHPRWRTPLRGGHSRLAGAQGVFFGVLLPACGLPQSPLPQALPAQWRPLLTSKRAPLPDLAGTHLPPRPLRPSSPWPLPVRRRKGLPQSSYKQSLRRCMRLLRHAHH